jgi:hypothetical protein
MDALAEVSVRVKEINIVDLLTRYIVFSCFYEERDLGSY